MIPVITHHLKFPYPSIIMYTGILEQKLFNLEDFSHRWQKSRISAIAKSIGLDGPSCNLSEHDLLMKVEPEQRELVLRTVFDHSRLLGLGIVKYLGLSWEISDLAQILPKTGSPCFSGSWRTHNDAQVLERNACSELSVLGSFACNYWREALDGLVVGVGENERFTRHRSVGHGDDQCIDVLFTESYSPPRVVSSNNDVQLKKSLKYGAISSELSISLAPVQQRFRKMKVSLVVEGLSEGILFYRLDADEGVLCGAGGKMLHESFIKDLEKINPKVIARDSSPIAVYGGST